MVQKLNARALGYSLGILSALSMLLLGIIGNLGFYSAGVEAMQTWHLFFSLSVGGILAGMIEASVWGIVVGWLIAYFYNKFA